MVAARLNDGGLCLAVDAEQVARHTEMVVGVAFRLQNLAWPPCGKNCGAHLLGAGLAAASRDGQKRQVRVAPAVGVRDELESRQGVLHEKATAGGGAKDLQGLCIGFALDTDAPCPRLGRLLHVVVSVGYFAHNRHKQRAWLHLSAVVQYARCASASRLQQPFATGHILYLIPSEENRVCHG